MSEDNHHIYEFGDFHLDSARRLLLRRDDDQPVKLTSKAFDTLLYMVRHGGVVLEKDELMRAVWPDTFVEENNLNQNVSVLRRALGERQGENRYIATVPGRGFSFVADVMALAHEDGRGGPGARRPEPVVAQAEVAPSYALQPERHAGGLRGRVWTAVFVGVLVAAFGVGAFYLWSAWTRTATGAPVRTIAVLPFKPLVPESRDEALELGMADTLIAKLSTSRGVIVRPISSVRRYGGVEQDPQTAGRELGVEAVLDGTIQRWGDRVRVTARLLSVGDNRTLWAGQFDGKFTDIFGVQDSISQRVAGELALRLTGEERELLAKRYTADAEAYQLYLKGRFFRDKRTREGTRRAVEYFEQALERDPTYALAYAGIAECYRGLPIQSDVRSQEAFPKAKAAVQKALELDPQMAEAYTTLGWIKFWYEWDWEGAEKEYRRALEINPNHPMAHLGYAHLMSNLGRHEEALEGVDRALKLEPLSPFNGAMKGQFLFHARRYPQAVDQLQKTLEIEPNFWIGQLLLGKSYELMGQHEDALEAFRKTKEFAGSTSVVISLSGYIYAVSGRREEAERELGELKATPAERYIPPYNLALVYHGLGDTTEAMRQLEKAYNERDVHMVFLGVDPQWDSLRGDPRFTGLLERMKLLK